MLVTPPVDDKIEALVGLVLEAVDQRLTAVREQLVEVANTIARHHLDLQQQIDECRELITSTRGGPLSASDHPADAANASASIALIEAANLLTDRVGSLESRLQHYTDEQIARVESLINTSSVAVAPAAIGVPAVIAMPAVIAQPFSGSSSTQEAPVVDPFDLDAFSAQLNARLSALVEKAIAT